MQFNMHAVPYSINNPSTNATALRPLNRNTLRYHDLFSYSGSTSRKLKCIDADLSKVKTSPMANTFKSKDELRGDLGNPKQPCCVMDAQDWPITFDGVMNPEGTGASGFSTISYSSFDTEVLWCVPHSYALTTRIAGR